MLVPITFKADGGDSSKKGKIRAEDLSVLSAFSLQNKTGVLKVLSECNYYGITTNSGKAYFYLNSGYVAICGRLVYIEEATQVEVTLPASGTVNGSFGIKIDLSAIGVDECKTYGKVGTLRKDDLNENPTTGVYEFELYKYQATNTTFQITAKTAEIIEDGDKPYKQGAIFTAARDGTIDSSKTIAEKFDEVNARLDSLGFNTATYNVTVKNVSSGMNVTVFKQGNWVFCSSSWTTSAMLNSWVWDSFPNGKVLFTLPEEWFPSSEKEAYVSVYSTGGAESARVSCCWKAKVNTSGQVVIVDRKGTCGGNTFCIVTTFAYKIGT